MRLIETQQRTIFICEGNTQKLLWSIKSNGRKAQPLKTLACSRMLVNGRVPSVSEGNAYKNWEKPRALKQGRFRRLAKSNDYETFS